MINDPKNVKVKQLKEIIMDLLQVLTVFGVITINLGVVITLYCQLDNKISAIHQEMTDFHRKMSILEERNKK